MAAARDGEVTREPDPRGAGGATGPVAAWLTDQGDRHMGTAEFFGELCDRLSAAGVPLSRASCGLFATHPQTFSRWLVWRREAGAQEISRPHGIEESDVYLDSPVALIHQGAAAIRRRLDVPDPQLDFPIVREMKDAGATDYVVMALRSMTGRSNYISWSTDRPGGFTTEQLAWIDDLLPLISLRLELDNAYFTARTLLAVYLGQGAGRRVLEGTVRRAQGEVIRAAIWYSDLRGFTVMAERVSPAELIETLGEYFDCMVNAVQEHGGEVLKFIGDGVLAIFPVGTGEARTACACSLDAAIDALARLVELNRRRAATGRDALRIGLALHVGDVIYGNIGAADRLDFTVIGSAVNLVCRVEPLCATLGRPVLVSETFVHCACSGELVSVGRHTLRGIAAPQELFTLPDSRIPT